MIFFGSKKWRLSPRLDAMLERNNCNKEMAIVLERPFASVWNISLRRFVSSMERKVWDQHGWFLGKHLPMSQTNGCWRFKPHLHRWLTYVACKRLWYIHLFGPKYRAEIGDYQCWWPEMHRYTGLVGILEDSMVSELMSFCVSRCMVVQNIGQKKTRSGRVLIHLSIWSLIRTILKERCG